MDKVRVGLLTIGQSPREDVISEIKPLFLPNIEILEKGLLDELRSEEIARLQPDADETPLVSCLRGGGQVQLGEKKIGSLLPVVIDSMQKETNIRAVGVLCTHDFPKIEFSFSVIFPFDYLNFLINRVLSIKSLGVVVPLESQVEMAEKKWEKEKVVVEAKSPYAQGKSWKEIAQKLNAEKVEAIILDCIGYRTIDKQEIQNLISVPILLPRVILAYAINQLFG